MRLLGAGHAPLHRFRVGLEFALSGHREVDGMIAHARRDSRGRWASSSGCPTRCSRRSAPPTSGGTGAGWPGELDGRGRPGRRRGSRSWPSSSRSRTASAGSRRRRDARPRAQRQAVRPATCDASCAHEAEVICRGLDTVGDVGRRDRRPSRRSPSCCRASEFDAALLAIANFVDLKSPYILGHSRAVADLAARGREPARAAGRRRSARCGAPGLVHDLGRLGVSNAIWDKRGPLGSGRVGARPPAPVPDRAHAPPVRRRSPRSARSPSQHRERLDGSGYPRGPDRRRDLPPGADPAARRTPTRRCASRVRTGPRARPTRPRCELRAEVRAGRLDAEAVEAVLSAAGHRVPRRREGPPG